MTVGAHDVYLWLADEWTGIKPNFDCVLIKLFWAPINQTVINEGAKKHTKNWNSMCQLGVSVMMTRRILNCWCWYCWIGCWCWMLMDTEIKWRNGNSVFCCLQSTLLIFPLGFSWEIQILSHFYLRQGVSVSLLSFAVENEVPPPPFFFARISEAFPLTFSGTSLLAILFSVCVYMCQNFSPSSFPTPAQFSTVCV